MPLWGTDLREPPDTGAGSKHQHSHAEPLKGCQPTGSGLPRARATVRRGGRPTEFPRGDRQGRLAAAHRRLIGHWKRAMLKDTRAVAVRIQPLLIGPPQHTGRDPCAAVASGRVVHSAVTYDLRQREQPACAICGVHRHKSRPLAAPNLQCRCRRHFYTCPCKIL